MCEFHPHDEDTDCPGASVNAFVDELAVLLTNSRIYSPSHPRVRDSLAGLVSGLEEILAREGRTTLEIGAADGFLIHDERPLRGASRSAPRLMQLLEAIGSGGIAFERGATIDDLLALVDVVNRRDLGALDLAATNGELKQAGAHRFRFLGAFSTDATPRDFAAAMKPDLPKARGPAKHALSVPERVYEGLFDHLTDVLMRIVRGDVFMLQDTQGQVEEMLARLNADAAETMDVASRSSTRADVFQFRHSIRVACLALNFARAMTDDRPVLLRIGAAALLHDVGKAQVSNEVLRHPGRLSDEQFREIQRHTTEGAKTLMRMPDVDPLCIAVAFGHHRTMDHGGYPWIRHDVDLSVATRIVKICDVYEALTSSVRRYRLPMPPRHAYRIMMGMQNHFDRSLLHRFIQVNGLYPIGEWVQMGSGVRARVMGQTDSLDLPLVRVEGEDVTWDLREPASRGLGEIRGLIQGSGADPVRDVEKAVRRTSRQAAKN